MVSNIFYFHPYLGKTSNLTNIFQMGWNHQPVIYLYYTCIYIRWCLVLCVVFSIPASNGGRNGASGTIPWNCSNIVVEDNIPFGFGFQISYLNWCRPRRMSNKAINFVFFVAILAGAFFAVCFRKCNLNLKDPIMDFPRRGNASKM